MAKWKCVECKKPKWHKASTPEAAMKALKAHQEKRHMPQREPKS